MFETRERYDGTTSETFNGTGELTGKEFNDLIAILRAWIKANKVKPNELDYVSITVHNESWEKRYDFTYNPNLIASKQLEVRGTVPIGIEEFIKTHWDVDAAE